MIIADVPATLGLRACLCSQITVYQACMEPSVQGVLATPAHFTAINKDTTEQHRELVSLTADPTQRMSDCSVRNPQSTGAGDLLPRIAASRDFFECRYESVRNITSAHEFTVKPHFRK